MKLKRVTPVRLEMERDGHNWRVVTAIRYDWLGTAVYYEVPADYVTDATSSPRFLWPIIPQWDNASPASILHDYLYASKEVSRKEADLIFREALAAEKISWWKRWSMYLAVRWFGWYRYGR